MSKYPDSKNVEEANSLGELMVVLEHAGEALYRRLLTDPEWVRTTIRVRVPDTRVRLDCVRAIRKSAAASKGQNMRVLARERGELVVLEIEWLGCQDDALG